MNRTLCWPKQVMLLLTSVFFFLSIFNAPAKSSNTLRETAANFRDANPALVSMFRNGLLNTFKQASLQADGTVYVRTGDIPAQWLRDSSAQVRPLLYFAKADPEASDLLRRAIARQAKYLVQDPYANAFTADFKIWERKFELDSLAYPELLAWQYWKVTGDTSIFTNDFARAMKSVLHTMTVEQNHQMFSPYRFKGLENGGVGKPAAFTGMVWSGFRASDDECQYPFNIADEMFAVVALSGMKEIEANVYHDQAMVREIQDVRTQIQTGIEKYGIVQDSQFGSIYAYEVDGKGNAILLDDANVPSLLSVPYLGYIRANSTVYQNTRRFILSSANRNFASGRLVTGVGSEHTTHADLTLGGTPEHPAHYAAGVHNVWPLALAMQGLTAETESERKAMIAQLLLTDPGDGLLHESLNPDDSQQYTRPDFGWPNALFAELVLLDRLQFKPLPSPDISDLSFKRH